MMVVHNHLPDTRSLESVLDHVDRVDLIDNCSDSDTVEYLKEFVSRHPGKCFLLENQENLGISRAYNQAVREARLRGVHWIWFVDHDAKFDDSLVLETLALWNELEGSGMSVGMVVPIVGDDPSIFKSTLGLHGKSSTVRSAITSGILTNADVFSSLGGFDETFHSYGADVDLTIRCVHSGYGLFRVNRVLVCQDFGERLKVETSVTRGFELASLLVSRVMLNLGFGNVVQTHIHTYTGDRTKVQLETTQRINRGYRRAFLWLYYGISHFVVRPVLKLTQ